MWSKKNNPYYPDIPIFLIIVPIIAAYNYYLTYPDPTIGWYLVITFLLDTFQGYLAVLAVRMIIIYLDKTLPYEDQFIKRILTQILWTVPAGLLVIILLTEGISFLVRGKWAHPSFYEQDIFIISIWFFVVNGIYLVIHFQRQWSVAETAISHRENLFKNGFLVTLGTKEIRLNFEDITAFYIEDEHVLCVDKDQKRYYLNQSLNELESQLPQDLFFRLNRQFILNLNAINGYNRLANGKLEILQSIAEQLPSTIIVSRTKAPAFKKWFQP